MLFVNGIVQTVTPTSTNESPLTMAIAWSANPYLILARGTSVLLAAFLGPEVARPRTAPITRKTEHPSKSKSRPSSLASVILDPPPPSQRGNGPAVGQSPRSYRRTRCRSMVRRPMHAPVDTTPTRLAPSQDRRLR